MALPKYAKTTKNFEEFQVYIAIIDMPVQQPPSNMQLLKHK